MVIMIEAEGDNGTAGREPATHVDNVVALPRRGRGYSGVTTRLDQPSSSWRSGHGDAGSARARQPAGASAQSSGAPAYNHSAPSYGMDRYPGSSAQHSSQQVTQAGRSGLLGEQESRDFADIRRGGSMYDDRFPWEQPWVAQPSLSGMAAPRMLGGAYNRGPSLLPGSAVQTEYSETAEAGRMRAPGCSAPPLSTNQQQQQRRRQLGSPELPSALSSLVFPEDNRGFGSPWTRRAGDGVYAHRPAALGSRNPMLHGRGARGLFPVMADAMVVRPRRAAAPVAPSLDAVSNLPPDQLDSWLADWAGVPAGRAAAGRMDTSEEDEELEIALQHQQHTRNRGRQGAAYSGSTGRLEPMALLGSGLPAAYRLAVM